MISAYWNALRIGDDVCVHDDLDLGFALVEGKVAFVDAKSGSNAVTVRVADVKGSTTLLHPKRLAVHLLERDSRVDCWRCQLRGSKRALS